MLKLAGVICLSIGTLERGLLHTWACNGPSIQSKYFVLTHVHADWHMSSTRTHFHAWSCSFPTLDQALTSTLECPGANVWTCWPVLSYFFTICTILKAYLHQIVTQSSSYNKEYNQPHNHTSLTHRSCLETTRMLQLVWEILRSFAAYDTLLPFVDTPATKDAYVGIFWVILLRHDWQVPRDWLLPTCCDIYEIGECIF